MNNDATHSGGSCAVEGKTFFLVGFSRVQCQDVTIGFEFPCRENVFQKLPGIEKLSDYGFDKDSIIRRSVVSSPCF